jgi:hypothetical protein
MPDRDGIRKLTKEDVPELDDTDIGPSERYYCRIFVEDTWGGWRQISCSGDVASENDCAAKAPREKGAYGWTRRPC